MMTGFTDLHTHLVYGVDDGAKTYQDMTDMLDAAHRQGVARIFATSHAEPGMRGFDHETYLAHLEEGRLYCAERGYDLQLETGAELLYTPAMDAWIQERKLITLGNTAYVLVEFVPDVAAKEIEWMLEQMNRQRYRPILAHIERYDCMKGRFPASLKQNYTVQFQVNCRTVLDTPGFFQRRKIHQWFASGLIDYVATDMHNCTSRPPRMQKAYRALAARYGQEYANRLTHASGLKNEE